VRLFVGFSIPAAIVARLAGLLDVLRPHAEVRWSRLDALHVTTKFIGEQPVTSVPDLTRELEGLCTRAPFCVAVRGVGWFPNAQEPRVFWAGIERSVPLVELARDTERALLGLGVPEERRAYAPHLTLARVPASARLERLRAALAQLPSTEFGTFTVDRFTLYESRRSNDVEHYRTIATFELVSLGRPASDHDR
jgi:2'-5' RNA ligase